VPLSLITRAAVAKSKGVSWTDHPPCISRSASKPLYAPSLLEKRIHGVQLGITTSAGVSSRSAGVVGTSSSTRTLHGALGGPQSGPGGCAPGGTQSGVLPASLSPPEDVELLAEDAELADELLDDELDEPTAPATSAASMRTSGLHARWINARANDGRAARNGRCMFSGYPSGPKSNLVSMPHVPKPHEASSRVARYLLATSVVTLSPEARTNRNSMPEAWLGPKRVVDKQEP
jgi:hypothetical protein